MFNLATPTSVLRVITGAGVASISVHVSFVDRDASGSPVVVTPGWQNKLITTATTTQVCDPPTGAAIRNVKFVAINNTSGAPCLVAVQQFDGALASRNYGPVILQPAWSLHYTTEGKGWVLYGPARIQQGAT